MTARATLRLAEATPCAPWPRHVLTHDEWRGFASTLADDPGLELLGMWADARTVYALFHEGDGDFLFGSVPVEDGRYPALSPARLAAAWMERMISDLWGHSAAGRRDTRPWLDHGKWEVVAPLGPRSGPRTGTVEPPEFLPAEGEDIHQIPVGPVHAGIIEPGHFRFSAQGETIVRLEARLGYTHKGTLSLIHGKSPRAAIRFAARLSGDSTVAHAIAFARAAEAASAVEPPPRAVALRAVMGEMERIANHLGDIGAICNDAAFAFMLARFGWHREGMLRAANVAFGHRLMMDCVVPGGVAANIAPGGPEAIVRTLAMVEAELPSLVRIYEDYSSLVDRVVTTGKVSPALVASFAAGGFIGRAAGRAFDVRRTPGYAPYDRIDVNPALLTEGDVDARVRIRIGEVHDSILILRTLLASLPEGGVSVPLPPASGEGIGWAEGFRGDIWHWLRLEGGMISAAFLRDPSWLQWPLLEAAIHGNIVADFPLCNKSFNCSYSGVDL